MNDCLCCRIRIRFRLRMDDCVRPIPNNFVPNPVLLSMITDQNVTRHLTYYATVASNYWTATTGNSLLNGIPIYSPGSSLTNIWIDISNSVEGFLLVWTQYNYIPNGERWAIQIRRNTDPFINEQLYCYSNGRLNMNNNWILMNDGNGSSPRVVSLCFKKYSNATCPNFSIPMNPASSSSTYVSHDNITCLTSEITTSPNDETSSMSLTFPSITSSFSTSSSHSSSTEFKISNSHVSRPYVSSSLSPSPSFFISDTSHILISTFSMYIYTTSFPDSSIISIPTSTSTSISTTTSISATGSPEPTCTPDNIWPETPIGEIARGTCINGIFNGM